MVKIIHGNEDFEVIALVDSGADYCLFDAEIGSKGLGLNIKSVQPEMTGGVGSQAVPVYYHDVELEVGGKRWGTRAGFIENPGIGALLGREGFFSKFKVCFDQPHGKIMLED